VNDEFYKYFFDCFVAYAFKRGVPRSVAKDAREMLAQHFEKVGTTDQPEPGFDLVIEQIRVSPPPLRPPPPPRPKVQVPPEKPVRVVEPIIATRSVVATESIEDYTERFYDPPSDNAVDVQMRTGFDDRMAAIDWRYYFQAY
jgi:hypothetical protein